MNGKIKIIADYEYDASVCIGEGAFGKVYKGIHNKTKEVVAIKQMDAGPIRRDQYLSSALKKEVEILRKLQHINIVRLIDFFESQNSFYLITEFCDSGDLKQYMKNFRQGAPESEAQIIFSDIVDGINAMYQVKATHRDLKPANILKNGNRYKIADFGFAKVLDGTGMNLHQTCVGSPLYMAPQILARKAYNAKCDLWSLGVMYYEVLTGRTPFSGVNEQDLLMNIKKYQFRPLANASQLSNSFLQKALQQDEEKRISFEETFEIFKQFKQINKGKSIVQVDKLQESTIIINPMVENKFQSNPESDRQKQIKIQQLTIIKQFLGFISFTIYEAFSNYRICNEFQVDELEIEALIYMMAKYVEIQSLKALDMAKGIDEEQLISVKQQAEYFREFLKDFENHMNILGLFRNLQDKEEIRQFKLTQDQNKLSFSIDQYIQLKLLANFKKNYKESINKDYQAFKDSEKEMLLKYMKILYYLLKVVDMKKQFEKNNQQPIDIGAYHQFKEKDLKKALTYLIDVEKFSY